MEVNTLKAIEAMFGSKVCTANLNIEGFGSPIGFDIYDGFAICEDYEGKQLIMEYPMMEAVRDSDEIASAILEYVGGIKKEEISPLHSLMTFNTLYVDGKEYIV